MASQATAPRIYFQFSYRDRSSLKSHLSCLYLVRGTCKSLRKAEGWLRKLKKLSNGLIQHCEGDLFAK
jgi:hypothetical protein